MIDNFGSWLRSQYAKCVDGDIRTLTIVLPLVAISIVSVVDLASKSPLFASATVGYLALSVCISRAVAAGKQRGFALLLAFSMIAMVGVVNFILSAPISACLAVVLVGLPVYFTRGRVRGPRPVFDEDIAVQRFVRECLTDEGLRWAVTVWGRRER